HGKAEAPAGLAHALFIGASAVLVAIHAVGQLRHARLAGAGPLRLCFVCVLPTCRAPRTAQATLSFSPAILAAAALGFL
ncbi:hypothetical protein QMO42_30470, partial [Pseudomonas aeruginosa]|nr:hypothetical protein [Pseudomonas aeruginosa]